jgi:hypothetical protein
MAWHIKCIDTKCGCEAWAGNIVDLISGHRGEDGLFRSQCGKPGYITKSFSLQEQGETWEPYLRGLVTLGRAGETYQPFVFLVSYEPAGPISDIWFSYYKDLRASGGRLKLGHGPGGPPVLGAKDVLTLVERLIEVGCVKRKDIERIASKVAT